MLIVGEQTFSRYMFSGGPDPYSESFEFNMSESNAYIKLFLTTYRQYPDVPAGVSPQASTELVSATVHHPDSQGPFQVEFLSGTAVIRKIIRFHYSYTVCWGYMEGLGVLNIGSE